MSPSVRTWQHAFEAAKELVARAQDQGPNASDIMANGKLLFADEDGNFSVEVRDLYLPTKVVIGRGMRCRYSFLIWQGVRRRHHTQALSPSHSLCLASRAALPNMAVPPVQQQHQRQHQNQNQSQNQPPGLGWESSTLSAYQAQCVWAGMAWMYSKLDVG